MATTTGLHYRTATKWDLSDRQRQVLDLVARGYTNPQIGAALGITLDGAKFHVSEVMGKLGVSSREEAARWWRDYNRPAARLHRLVAPLFAGSAWKIAGAGVAVAAASAVAIVAIVALQSGDEAEPEAPPAAETDVPAAGPFVPAAFRAQIGSSEYSLDLRPDGTFNLTSGNATFQGTYAAAGSELTIDDRAFGSICETGPDPGTYAWSRTSEGALLLRAVNEPCKRRADLWARTWQSQ